MDANLQIMKLINLVQRRSIQAFSLYYRSASPVISTSKGEVEHCLHSRRTMNLSKRSAQLLCLTRGMRGNPLMVSGGFRSVDETSASSSCSLKNRHSCEWGGGDGIVFHPRAFCALPPGCWRCGVHDKGQTAFCKGCGGIQPLKSGLDHFNALGLERSFDIDLALLESTFKRSQMKLHPDRFASKTAQEQEFSSEQSAKLNVAYKTLKSPLNRAKYLLELKGAKESTIDDPELLMQVMENQERVAEISTQEELLEMLKEAKSKETSLFSQLSQAFLADDVKSASKLVHELTYLARLKDQIDEKSEHI